MMMIKLIMKNSLIRIIYVLVNSCRTPHPSISVVLLVGCAVFILVIVLLCVSFVVDCISLLGVESFDFLTLWIITCVDFQNPRQGSLCPCTHSVWSDPGAHVSQTYILFMFLIFFPPPAPLCEGPQSHRLATQTCLKHPENMKLKVYPKELELSVHLAHFPPGYCRHRTSVVARMLLSPAWEMVFSSQVLVRIHSPPPLAKISWHNNINFYETLKLTKLMCNSCSRRNISKEQYAQCPRRICSWKSPFKAWFLEI